MAKGKGKRESWYGVCGECGEKADLAYRPGTTIKVCAKCMYPEDHGAARAA